MAFGKRYPIHILLVFGVSLASNGVIGYSREKLQKLYPGFGTKYVLFPDEDNNPVYGYLEIDNDSRVFFEDPNLEQDIKLEFFSREYPNGVPITKKHQFAKYVNTSQPTKFVTHGWMSAGNKDACVLIRDGWLHRYDANIFVLDWSAISGNPYYPIPMRLTSKVGKYYGQYLNHLVDNVGVKPEDIHLVGHSLGAHVSGFAARSVRKGKIGRLTGLDPALPGFNLGPLSPDSLDRNDAQFVDVIHTCAGFLGYLTPLGHADFYPNGGGPPQPGCNILEFMEACSHGRSFRIFASTLLNDTPYLAKKCSNFLEIVNMKKCSGVAVPLGDSTPTNITGMFFSKILPEELVVSLDDKNKIR